MWNTEDEPVGEALLQGGVVEQPADELPEFAGSIARSRRRRSVATSQLHLQSVPCSVEVLQVLGGPQTPQFALDHDPDARTERVGLLHGVRGQDRPSGTLKTGQDGVPQEPLAARVHPGAGFVQQDHLRVADHGHGERELAPGSPRALLGLLIRVLVDLQPRQVQVDDLRDIPERDPYKPMKRLQNAQSETYLGWRRSIPGAPAR